MSTGQAVSVRGPVARGTPAPVERAPTAVEFRYTQTESFPTLLKQLGASLLVTTYQANKLLVARPTGGGLSMLVRTFERPSMARPIGRSNVRTSIDSPPPVARATSSLFAW